MLAFFAARSTVMPVPLRFMDIVEWNSLEEAEAAAMAVEKEETVAAFMQAIASIEMMSHFCDA